MKLGKRPASSDPRDLKFATYLDATVLPTPPAKFGHQDAFPAAGWGMLGNDQYGDCVWAGAAHETMVFDKLGGTSVAFDPHAVLSDYSACTGFNPNDPNSDQGTDMRKAAGYRRSTGVIDRAGKRHKIAAYISLTPGGITHTLQAAYLFEAVGIGIQFPSTAMDQFNAHKPWDVVAGAKIEGGHYVPLLGADATYLYVVTWGQVQRMTHRFFTKYCDEALVYLTQEDLRGGKSVEGFDLAQLRSDLSALAA